jgi:hypothetical protein
LLHRRLIPTLGLGVPRAFEKEVRIPMEVFGRRERDRVDAVLGHGPRRRGKRGNSTGERLDERAELLRRQRAVDPPVALRELRVVVLGAQNDLERTAASQEPGQVLDPARPGDQAEALLHLSEDRRLPRREAHVASQHELASGASDSSLDLGDRDEAAGAQVPEHQTERRLAGELRRLVAILGDPGHVHVRDEVVRVGAEEHDHPHALVGLGPLNQRDQVADQLGSEEIHRRSGDFRKEDSAVAPHPDRLERCHPSTAVAGSRTWIPPSTSRASYIRRDSVAGPWITAPFVTSNRDP